MKYQLNRYNSETVAFCVKNPRIPTYDECLAKLPLLGYMWSEQEFGEYVWDALTNEYGTANNLGEGCHEAIDIATKQSLKQIKVDNWYFEGRMGGWYIIEYSTHYNEKFGEDRVERFIESWIETIVLPTVQKYYNSVYDTLMEDVEFRYNENLEAAVKAYYAGSK